MQAKELKFLLKLLGYEGYRAPIKELAPDDKTRASDRDKICVELGKREIVEYSREVKRFKISAAGRALLKQETEGLPLTENHVLILERCEKRSITPGELKKLPANEKQPLIQELAAKGLVEVEQAQIKEVQLTHRGAEFLRRGAEFSRDQGHPTGRPTVSLNLLGNYLNFLRKATRTTATTEAAPTVAASPQKKPTDEEILQMICNLDRELGTNNYLPIFYLRRELQSSLSRAELDQALYRLQRQEKLDLSSLVESIHYSSEEIQAGIAQDAGGPLFFLIANK